jgi:hypothetical protein
MNKHTRPFKCTISGCKERRFGTSGDLVRHHREVHSAPTFKCPVVLRSRHRKGFGRRDNLAQHMKRVHKTEELTSNSPLNKISMLSEIVSSDPQTKVSTFGDNSPVSEILESRVSTASNKTAILEKIHELEMMKEESNTRFDGDIAALRRVLSIM